MEECCGPSPAYAKSEEDRKKKEEADMNREFVLNGTKLKIKDMFVDHWAAKDFLGKLNLLEKSTGGKALLDSSVDSIMDDTDEQAA